MKKILPLLLLVAITGCETLGIGKQCYTCTVRVFRTSGATVSESKKDICGQDEMETYKKDNTVSAVNGVGSQCTCVSK